MKTFMLILGGLLAICVTTIAPAKAAYAASIIGNEVCAPNAAGETPAVCKDDKATASDSENPLIGPEGVVTRGVQIFAMILGITSIVVILINAVRMITSNGDAQSIAGSRNGLFYAIIGIVIALSAQIIVTFILQKV